jgi:hypothetical protein
MNQNKSNDLQALERRLGFASNKNPAFLEINTAAKLKWFGSGFGFIDLSLPVSSSFCQFS